MTRLPLDVLCVGCGETVVRTVKAERVCKQHADPDDLLDLEPSDVLSFEGHCRRCGETWFNPVRVLSGLIRDWGGDGD